MKISPKFRRLLWTSAVLLVILIAFGGLFTLEKFFRQGKQVFASAEEQFKYGSLGAEGDRGIPYYLWLVLPRVFPDLMPGPRGYKSFDVVWEEGREIPVGFSKKRVGFDRVTNNCAICHTATYREREEERPHVVVAAGSPVQLQDMLRFLFRAAHDPRFNADTIMTEIRLVSGNDYGNGGLSFIDRQIYRYLLIPLTRKALLEQEKTFTWMNRYVSSGQPKPDWGPRRDDAMKLTKYFMTGLPEDDSVGPTDFPSIWNLGIRSRKDKAGKQMLLNWTGDTSAVRSVLIDSALGLGAPPRPWFFAADGGSRSLPEQIFLRRPGRLPRPARLTRRSPRRARRSMPAIALPATSRAESLPAKWSRSHKSGPTRSGLVPGRKQRPRKQIAK